MANNSFAGALSATGNHVKIKSPSDFCAGQMEGLALSDSLSGAALQMVQAGEACWISPVYRTKKPFNDLVASWNVETPEGSFVEIFGRVWIPEYDGWTDPDGISYDGWSDWISWGKWSPYIARSCPHQQDSHPRKDSEEEDGWVFANSRYCGGDSSLNVRGSLTASAFQLKAVLHAEEDCKVLPSLWLLAATWKNTNDPAWQSDCSYPEEPVEPASSVLLDTPALSQMVRDPDYGNVICSATSITMLMNGQGADLLPEDVTMVNFDYAFGGNGNWSFTCAAAGAYGYESYVSYSSFEAVRQELTKGYAVGFSVKYSSKENDDQPYLINAPGHTNGHLITIVGYYFDEALGEYVYYSNDPGTDSDADTAHREYRQSQLDKCWYRRAAYFLHKKQDGAGNYVRNCRQASLIPAADRPGLWALTAEECRVVLPKDFLEGRREKFGAHGSILYYAEEELSEIPDTCRRVTANHKFRYDGITVTEDGYLTFAENAMEQLLAEGRSVKLMVLTNSGTVWTADVRG